MPLLLLVGLWWLAGLFVLAGVRIAPLNALAYEQTDLLAPDGTATEARMWTATATAAGSALGSAAAGAAVDGRTAWAAVLVSLAGAACCAALTLFGPRPDLDAAR